MAVQPWGTKRPKPWKPPIEWMEIYALVKRGHLTQKEIAERYEVSEPTINTRVHRIDDWLAPQWMDSIRSIKSDHTARLMHIYQESMQAWERSKEPEFDESMVIEKLTEKQREAGLKPVKVTKTQRGQGGNAAFLKSAMEALDRIRKIWGADAPEATAQTGHIRVAGRSPEEAKQEIVDRMMGVIRDLGTGANETN